MFAAGLLFLILLALFGRQMEPDWTYSVQYSYGWIVLPCAVYLGWLRWQDRPSPEPASRPLFFSCSLLLLFCLAPIRLVQEANPDWRLISWLLGSIVCGLALLLVYFCGGRAWLRHFIFPCLFPLVAIPWPTWIEFGLIQDLTRVVTSVTVEGLNLFGIPALQHGNLIELSQTWIGVNEACSGVRSFQATLMVALFLGEMFRFTWKLRLGFLVSGLALALAGNIVRAFFLSWVAAEGNEASLHRWHDPAGFTILAGVFIVLLIAAFRLDSKLRKTSAGPVISSGPRPPAILPRAFWVTAIVWLILAELGTEAWYRAHERDSIPTPVWNLQLPKNNPSLITDNLPPEAHSMLRYDEGYKAAWDVADGSRWSAIFLHWKPGRNAAQLAGIHAPEVCLSATGLQLIRDLGKKEMEAGGLVFNFRMLEFQSDSGPLYVFYLLWEDRMSPQKKLSGTEDYSSRSRWEAVTTGRRHLGQRLLEVAIARCPNPADAEKRLRNELPSLLLTVPR